MATKSLSKFGGLVTWVIALAVRLIVSWVESSCSIWLKLKAKHVPINNHKLADKPSNLPKQGFRVWHHAVELTLLISLDILGGMVITNVAFKFDVPSWRSSLPTSRSHLWTSQGICGCWQGACVDWSWTRFWYCHSRMLKFSFHSAYMLDVRKPRVNWPLWGKKVLLINICFMYLCQRAC